MVLAYLFVVASFLYGGAVYVAVVQSARGIGGNITLFDWTYTFAERQTGILILCGLAASAGVFIVWSLAVLRGQYLRRRQEREWVDDSTRSAGDAALELLLENRVNELEMSIDRLTAQRNDLVTEVRAAEARTSRRGKNGRVVIVPESSERLAVVETPPEPEIEAAEPEVEAAPAAAADEPA